MVLYHTMVDILAMFVDGKGEPVSKALNILHYSSIEAGYHDPVPQRKTLHRILENTSICYGNTQRLFDLLQLPQCNEHFQCAFLLAKASLFTKQTSTQTVIGRNFLSQSQFTILKHSYTRFPYNIWRRTFPRRRKHAHVDIYNIYTYILHKCTLYTLRTFIIYIIYSKLRPNIL